MYIYLTPNPYQSILMRHDEYSNRYNLSLYFQGAVSWEKLADFRYFRSIPSLLNKYLSI